MIPSGLKGGVENLKLRRNTKYIQERCAKREAGYTLQAARAIQ